MNTLDKVLIACILAMLLIIYAFIAVHTKPEPEFGGIYYKTTEEGFRK